MKDLADWEKDPTAKNIDDPEQMKKIGLDYVKEPNRQTRAELIIWRRKKLKEENDAAIMREGKTDVFDRPDERQRIAIRETEILHYLQDKSEKLQ